MQLFDFADFYRNVAVQNVIAKRNSLMINGFFVSSRIADVLMIRLMAFCVVNTDFKIQALVFCQEIGLCNVLSLFC